MNDRDKPAIGMGKVEIRHMLLLAGDEPLRTAVALGKDGKAIILLDRHKPPRTLEKELKEAAPDSHEHRFGTFGPDAKNPRLARFIVNRAAPGMARKLVIALKGTGLRRVEVGPEDGRDVDAAQDEDDDGYVQTYDPAARQRAAHDQAADEAAAEHAALSRMLAGLVHEVMQVAEADHASQPPLIALADTAQASLKHGELAKAAHSIKALRDALIVANRRTS